MTVMAFLYYRPIASYLETRSERETRLAQVVALRAEKQSLERRLARTTCDAALARPGYRIGEMILAEAVDPWPADACCFLDGERAS